MIDGRWTGFDRLAAIVPFPLESVVQAILGRVVSMRSQMRMP